jgi:glycosyltransferase involved in cell wall biosynthesis
MPNPLVSVILPCYKMGQFISEALESIGSQVYTEWEVIAVDDCGPEDGTRAVIEAFASRHLDHRIELICHETNQGVGAARNTAIAAAKGDFLAFLDPDDHWKPDHLKRSMGQFEEFPSLGVTSSSVEVLWEGEESRVEQWLHGGWTKDEFPYSMCCVNFIQMSSAVARRSVVVSVMGFSKDTELIEDYDLWIRLIANGIKFGLLEDVTSCYRKHSEGATANHRRMDELHENLMSRHTGFFLHSQARLIGGLVAQAKHRDQEMGSFFLRRLLWAGSMVSAIIKRLKGIC